LILSDVADKDKKKIEAILKKYGVIDHTNNASAIRKNSIACVALNTCPLALAEAQRYLPTLISKIEPLLEKYDLQEEEIIIRMTGCPNGCGRSSNSEIGFIGTALGHYNLHIGGDHLGLRLNRKYKESLNEEAILQELDFLFKEFKEKRKGAESFGDFSNRLFSTFVEQNEPNLQL
jgi:sulfite reductase (NADPH) hemoprotein beta-component